MKSLVFESVWVGVPFGFSLVFERTPWVFGFYLPWSAQGVFFKTLRYIKGGPKGVKSWPLRLKKQKDLVWLKSWLKSWLQVKTCFFFCFFFLWFSKSLQNDRYQLPATTPTNPARPAPLRARLRRPKRRAAPRKGNAWTSLGRRGSERAWFGVSDDLASFTGCFVLNFVWVVVVFFCGQRGVDDYLKPPVTRFVFEWFLLWLKLRVGWFDPGSKRLPVWCFFGGLSKGGWVVFDSWLACFLVVFWGCSLVLGCCVRLVAGCRIVCGCYSCAVRIKNKGALETRVVLH